MSKIVVYDFDGTLSYGDSMEELFNSKMRGIKTCFRIYYFFLKLLSKFKLCSVRQEKERMIKLLFHSDEQSFRTACEKHAESYQFTPVMDLLRNDVVDGNRVIVLSASSVFFLEKVFNGLNVEILGSTFYVKDGKILGIKQHPFYYEKVDTLIENKIVKVDEAYFDSKWDDCLKFMCRKWHRVKNGIIIEEN